MAGALYQDWENYNPNNPTVLRPPSYWDAVKQNLPHALSGIKRMPSNVLGFPADIYSAAGYGADRLSAHPELQQEYMNMMFNDPSLRPYENVRREELVSDKPMFTNKAPLGSEWIAEKMGLPERTGHPTELGVEISGELALPFLGKSALSALKIVKDKLPEFVGKHVPEPFRTPISGLNMIDAYHGSPHRFSKFSTESIGTGEGAQSYGHGLYFAENPKVAKRYSELGNDQIAYSGHIDDVTDAVNKSVGDNEAADLISYWTYEGGFNPNKESLNDFIKSMINEDMPIEMQQKLLEASSDKNVIEKVNTLVSPKSPNIYNVKLDVDKKELLDWDVPLEKQGDIFNKIPKKDRRVLEDFIEDEMNIAPILGWNLDLSTWTGGKFKQLLGRVWDTPLFPKDHILGSAQEVLTKEEAISAYLKSKGIKGITYKDALSRFSKTEEPTNNIVIFDDSLVSIVDDAVK